MSNVKTNEGHQSKGALSLLCLKGVTVQVRARGLATQQSENWTANLGRAPPPRSPSALLCPSRWFQMQVLRAVKMLEMRGHTT